MSKQELRPDFVEVCTLNGGKNLVVNDRRVCGPDYGGGDVGQTWNVRKSELLAALGLPAPSPVVMPEDVEEALAWVDEDIAADERAAEAGRREPHPLLNGQKRARTLARYIRSLSSPAPVEELPPCCDETAWYTVSLGLTEQYPGPAGVQVEIHPVGTRARLAALTGQAKKGGG